VVGIAAGRLRRLDWITVIAGVLALVAVVLALPVGESEPPTHAGAGTGLSVAWVDRASRIEVVAIGFRSRSAVEVRVGDQVLTGIRADEVGVISLQVPLDAAGTDKSGASVLVTGRAPSGAARALAGAVPPRPAGHGPVDVTPWSLLAVAIAVGVGWYRRRSRREAGENDHNNPELTDTTDK